MSKKQNKTRQKTNKQTKKGLINYQNIDISMITVDFCYFMPGVKTVDANGINSYCIKYCLFSHFMILIHF